MQLKTQWLTEEVKEETKNIRRQMKMKRQWSKIHEMKQKQFLRAKFIAIEA